jgi:large subunit ribosomal protein L31
MKTEIQPEYSAIKVTCSCGHVFETRSTLCKDLAIEVCSNCHPFYTGKQKIVDTGGRVQRFMDRYNRPQKPEADQEKTSH